MKAAAICALLVLLDGSIAAAMSFDAMVAESAAARHNHSMQTVFPTCVPNPSFEEVATSNGNAYALTSWTVSDGQAFGDDGVTATPAYFSVRYAGASPNPHIHGQYMLLSSVTTGNPSSFHANGAETPVGKITSASWVVTKQYVCFYYGGFWTEIGVDLAPFDGVLDVKVVPGTNAFRQFATTHGVPGGDGWDRLCLDVSAHVGEEAKFVFWDNNDGNAGAWGIADGITCQDTDVTWTTESYTEQVPDLDGNRVQDGRYTDYTDPVYSTSAGLGGEAGATGDPHLTNVYGERFDLYRPGVHVLLQVPRTATPPETLLLVQADAQRLGAACTDMYFQVIKISGTWTNQTSPLQFSARADATLRNMIWTRFGTIDLKVKMGQTTGGINYLNIFAKHLRHSGYHFGGLLGDDDHMEVSSPSTECAVRIALRRRLQSYASAV